MWTLGCWEGLPTIAGVVTAIGASVSLILRESVVLAREHRIQRDTPPTDTPRTTGSLGTKEPRTRR